MQSHPASSRPRRLNPLALSSPESRPLLSTLAILTTLTCLISPTPKAHALDRLPYQNPGLTMDLGVGLWAWPIPCDADGDGDFDLVVSCPDKPSNGVWLFENPGKPNPSSATPTSTPPNPTNPTSPTNTSNPNKFPTFKPARRLSATVPYLMPSWVDGQLRVLSPGWEYQNFTRTGIAEKTKLPVPPDFYKPTGTAPGGPRLRHRQWRWSDHNGDGRPDLIAAMEDWSHYGWDNAWNPDGIWQNGPLHGYIFVFHNNPDGTFSEPRQILADGKPLDTFGCPSPNFVDFDKDGDDDLICGEFLDGFTYYQNTGTRQNPQYSAARRLRDPSEKEVRMELEMIVPIAFDWDRDGDLDLITGDEDGRVALVENNGALTKENTPIFQQPVYFRQEADTLKCGALATPFVTDWDGDGDQDIVSGNTAGFIEIFENLSGPKTAQPRWAAPRRLLADGHVFRIMAGPNGSIQGPAEAKWGYTAPVVADWNGDGLPDIVFNSILGDVQWLENIGTRAAPSFPAPRPIEVEWPGPPPSPAWGWRRAKGRELLTQWRTTPVVHDLNNDQLPDLAMLDQEGYLAFFERFRAPDGTLRLKPPRRAFLDETGTPLRLNSKSAGGSGRRKLCVTDWDGDGKTDFLLNSANADFLRQTGSTNNTWTFKNEGALDPKNIEGHDVSPAVSDFDGDGIPDFLGGAEDGRFYTLTNPRASRP
ncbi:MAG: repeat protein [Verrucomicrobiales bacterium]|nr:repeat protein [Verrucomicrobiales bacterium]